MRNFTENPALLSILTLLHFWINRLTFPSFVTHEIHHFLKIFIQRDHFGVAFKHFRNFHYQFFSFRLWNFYFHLMDSYFIRFCGNVTKSPFKFDLWLHQDQYILKYSLSYPFYLFFLPVLLKSVSLLAFLISFWFIKCPLFTLSWGFRLPNAK